MSFTDFNAANKQRLRRNAQRHTDLNAAASVALSSTGGLQNSGGLGIKLDGTSLSLSSSGLRVAVNGVSFAMFQQITTDRLLGRDTAGTGNVEEIAVGGGIEFTGGPGIQTSAFTGDVTKTAGGTALTIANDAVTFAKFQNITDNRLLGRSAGSTGDMQEIIIGTGLTLSAGTLSNSGSGTTLANDTLWAAKGDLAVATANDTATVLSAGANERILVADSNATEGVAWRLPIVATDVRYFNQTIVSSGTKTVLGAATGKVFAAADVTEMVSSTAKITQTTFSVSSDLSCATASDTFTIYLEVVGTTTVTIHSHTITLAGTESNVPIIIEAWGSWHDGASGASAKASGELKVFYGTTSTVSIYTAQGFATATAVDASGATNNFQISVQWSTGRAGNSFTHRGGATGIRSRGRAVI